MSYNMVAVYAKVVSNVSSIGYDRLVSMPDDELALILRPIGLAKARNQYFRSLVRFIESLERHNVDPLTTDLDEFIREFAGKVDQANFKVAQCAALYSRGYHCGIIPVDSGMVTRLAPRLGMKLSKKAIAHEEMRLLLQACVHDRAFDYRSLFRGLNYNITLPSDALPTWGVHLILIYFKRFYCNRPNTRLCPRQPVCAQLFDCDCVSETEGVIAVG